MSVEGDAKEQLKEWLVKGLEPICDADPEVLSKYVLALVQGDINAPALHATCVQKLEEFLGSGKNIVYYIFQFISSKKLA